MNPLSVPLPIAARRRGEVVGCVAGVACFLFANSQSDGSALILPVVIASGIAGAIASATATTDNATAPFRVGARAGFVAAMVGGAVTVLATALQRSWESFSQSAVGVLPLPIPTSMNVVIVALLALLPGIFFGLLGALIVSAIRNPSSSVNTSDGRPKERQTPSAVFVTAWILSVLCYLSPLVVKPKSPDKAAAQSRQAESSPTREPSVPTKKWRYEKPADFETADAMKVTIVAHRQFENVDADLPMAFSPDGKWLAHFTNSRNRMLHLVELDTLDTLYQSAISGIPTDLEWSPDSERLFIPMRVSDTSVLTVFDMKSLRLHILPYPRGNSIPRGRVKWWDATEVAFVADKLPLQFLELETLNILSSAGSAKWNALPKEKQDAAFRDRLTFMPDVTGWQFTTNFTLTGYTPSTDPFSAWAWKAGVTGAIRDKAYAVHRMLNGFDIRKGDTFTAPPDGTRLIRLRDGTADVFFFGIEAAKPTHGGTIEMPSAPDSTNKAFTAAMESQSVCAFICEPVINPLNGRVLGPNRNVVKALARLSSWNDTKADYWIEQEFIPVSANDVIADLHTWRGGQSFAIGSLGRVGWFSALPSPTIVSPPMRNKALDLEIGGSMDFSTSKGTETFMGVTDAPPPNFRDNEEETAGPEAALHSFIANHHAKSSANDVDGLIANYADRVDHFDKGVVSREVVRAEEIQYHGPGVKVSELLTDEPKISAQGNNRYSAIYTIRYDRSNAANGKWSRGFADIELTIEITKDGPRIVRQRAKTRVVEKGP